ncbi:MAG: hypothetical protein IT380_18535 [Myxococcales bacterium]|nr:hypothetical protein [Myxococcales bacterium]
MPTRIGQRLSVAVKDRTVSRAEAEEIVQAARAERKWTPALQGELSTFVMKHGSKMDAQAKAVLEDFISSSRPRADLRDPLALKEHRTDVTWTPVGPDASLFVDGITADDVMQGYIGDCYLAAGVASLAAADPELIKKAIKDNGDGTFTVRFFEGVGEGGRARQVRVTVDDDVAKKPGGEALYLSARDGKEEWPAVLEKAYAKWKGGYERIGNGGFASDLFQTVSGRAADWGEVKDYKPDALWKKIQSTTSRHRPVAAGTFADNDPRANYSGTGVHGDHFYTVLGATEEGGVKYVTLRNPWGMDEPTGNGADDGVFKLPLTDFVKMYENIEFGG